MHNFYKGNRSDEWRTPDEVFKPLHDQYKFVFDLAASAENTRAARYHTKENDSLECPWPITEMSWLNPPFSMAKKFYEKTMKLSMLGARIVSIYKAANQETETWQRFIFPSCSWVYVLDRRTNFINSEGVQGNGVTFGCAIIGWNVEPPTGLTGTVLRVQK